MIHQFSTGGTSTNYTSTSIQHEGGPLNFACQGTFGSASMTLQCLPPGSTAGSTLYLSVGDEAVMTTAGVARVHLNAGCRLRVAQAGSTGNAAIRAEIF